MPIIANYWKRRADKAEADLADANLQLQLQAQGLKVAQEHLAGIELRFADRAALVSIERVGKANRFMFVRNGQTVLVECYATIADDIAGWRKALLERPSDV